MVTSLLKHASSILAIGRRTYSNFPLNVSHLQIAAARKQFASAIRHDFVISKSKKDDIPLNRIKHMKDDIPLAAPDVCRPLRIMRELSENGDIVATVITKANSREAAINSLLDILDVQQTLRTMAIQFNQFDQESKPKYYKSYRQGKSEKKIESDLTYLETMFKNTLNKYGIVFNAYLWKLTEIDKQPSYPQFSEARTELIEHYEERRKFFNKNFNTDHQYYLLSGYHQEAQKSLAAWISEVKPLWFFAGTTKTIMKFKKLQELFDEGDLIGAAKLLQTSGIDIYATECIRRYIDHLKLVENDMEARKIAKYKSDLTTEMLTALRSSTHHLPSPELLLVVEVASNTSNLKNPLPDIEKASSALSR